MKKLLLLFFTVGLLSSLPRIVFAQYAIGAAPNYGGSGDGYAVVNDTSVCHAAAEPTPWNVSILGGSGDGYAIVNDTSVCHPAAEPTPWNVSILGGSGDGYAIVNDTSVCHPPAEPTPWNATIKGGSGDGYASYSNTTLTAGNNGPICTGGTLSLSTPTINFTTYSWTGPNSFSSTAQNPTISTSATTTMSGTYTVTATSTCGATTTQTATTVATVNAGPPSVTLLGASSVCANQTINLSVLAPTGGTISQSGGNRIHTFTTTPTTVDTTSFSFTFTVPTGVIGNVAVLVVAGGGGGGQTIGGGGGGGGVIYNGGYAVTAGTYSITVGGGGAGYVGNSTPAYYNSYGGEQGKNSIFGTLTANGGGGGGNFDGTANGATTGGSGGGIGAGNGATAEGGTQGYSGGTTATNNNDAAGGGGTGAVGGNSVSGTAGAGGIGASYSISGSSVYYSGGGGGGARNPSGTAGGGGGTGGGGSGGYGSAPGSAGSFHTGGGGGGGGYQNSPIVSASGGNGGSGIVIISYPDITAGTWASLHTNIATVNSSGVVTGVTAGTDSISYTVTSGSCSSVAYKVVTVNATPSVPSVTAVNNCNGTSTLSTTAAGSLIWSPGNATTSSMTVSTAGTYSVITTVNGCASASGTGTPILASCNFSFTVKFFIQGYYIGGGKMSPLLHLIDPTHHGGNDVDTATVELHSSVNPDSAAAYSFTSILQSNDSLSCIFPGGASDNSYYIVVKHRNSTDTWSANTVSVSSGGSYNFTSGAGQAYSNNMVNLGGGIYGIYSGDILRHGLINTSDKASLQSVISSFQMGVYNINDITGDGFVDEEDYRILENNIPLGVSVKHP